MHKQRLSKIATFGIQAELFSNWIFFVDDEKFCDIILNELMLRHNYVFVGRLESYV